MISAQDVLQCQSVLSELVNLPERMEVSTDSRILENENAFVCLYGASFDAFGFIPEIVGKNVRVVFVERKIKQAKELQKYRKDFPDVSFVETENIFSFLLELGSVRAKRFRDEGGKLIGLTGSNGKTTNKEMLHQLLKVPGATVLATKGNLNNQIGVPLTLFRLSSEDVAIIEMGTNLPGEIKILSECVKPEYGLITNIGYAHIEHLKDLDGVFREKSALFKAIENYGGGHKKFVANCFDSYLSKLQGPAWVKPLSNKNFQERESGFSLIWEKHEFTISNRHLLGTHQKTNMAQCMLLALEVFPESFEAIVENAKNYEPPKMNRGELREVGQTLIYLDAYNANPNSMRASLNSYKALMKARGRDFSGATFILGDMNELGEEAPRFHEELGKDLLEMGVEEALFVGRYASSYAQGFTGGKHKVFATVEELKAFVKNWGEWPSNLFIKASRSLQLESILDIKN